MAYYRGFFGVVPGVWVFRVFEQAVFTSTRDTHEKKKAATTTLHVNHVNLSVFLSCLSREVFKCTDFSLQMVRFGNFTWYTRARRERNALKL